MKYTNIGGYMIPNLVLTDQPKKQLSRYGMMRLNYLKQTNPILVEQQMMKGTLYSSLLRLEQEIEEQISLTMKQLAEKQPGPEKKSNPLGWTQWMNGLKLQAEEMVLPMLYERVFEIWRDTAEQRYTQMIFSDLSTPGGKSAPMETVQKEDGSFEVVPGQFQNVYEDIRNKLIALGVPPEEVQFIHSAKTEAQKEEMFAKMRSGKVRILLGSTSRMGAGTNAQRLLVALHHLDVPWRPADIQQREGRMIRQGNLCKEVSVYRYVTEATFDSYSWGLIENKQRFISQVYTSRSPVRSCEDVDELTLSYAELKALTAGNPKIKEKMDLEIQVSRLITLKAAFDKQYYHLQNQVTTALPAAIAEMQKSIVDCQNDIATIDANSSFNSDGKLTFRMTVQGKEYIKMEDAGKALMVLEKAAASTADGMEVGQYRGMKLVLRFQPKSQSFVVDLVGHTKRVTDLSNDPAGNCIRINNRVNAIMEEYEKAKIGVVELEKQLESAKAELSVPWPNEQELKDKEARLAQLNRELKLDERTPTQYADEEEQDIQERKEPEYDEPEL